jgi:polar amino acid transport system substrate-binding protein
MRLRIVLIFCLLIPSAQSWAGLPLHFCYEDVIQAYWTRPDGSGVILDLLRKVESHLGEHFTYEPMPWTRCLEEVRIGTMDAAIGAGDAPERHEYAVYPILPDGSIDTRSAIWTDVFSVYYRAGSAVKWDGKNLVTPGNVVMAQRSYVIAGILRERGYKVVEAAKSSVDSLRLLAQDSVDAAILQGVQAQWLCANDARFKGKIVCGTTPYVVLPLYLLPSRVSYGKDAKRIQAIWAEIRNVRASAEYRKLEESAARSYHGN